MCEVLEQKAAARSKSIATRLGEIAGYVRDAISHARLMARGLSPIVLESEGLMSGLQELASNTEKIFGVECRFECGVPVLVNDHAMATHIFRIAQEAVSNAIRHGKASRLCILLESHPGKLLMMVTDNGRGLPAAPAGNGMGLRIMQSRASMIGGNLTVENRSEGGVRVTCTIALASASTQHEQSGSQENAKG